MYGGTSGCPINDRVTVSTDPISRQRGWLAGMHAIQVGVALRNSPRRLRITINHLPAIPMGLVNLRRNHTYQYLDAETF
jgi:hypothetical protein